MKGVMLGVGGALIVVGLILVESGIFYAVLGGPDGDLPGKMMGGGLINIIFGAILLVGGQDK